VAKQPRIMHVIAGLAPGGTEMMCLRLARHWQHRFDQDFVPWTATSGILERLFRDVRHSDLWQPLAATGSRLQRFLWFRDLIRRRAPDAVLIHCFGIPHLIVAAAARSAGVEAIGAWAGNPPPGFGAARWRSAAVLAGSRLLACPVAMCSAAVNNEFRKLGVGMPAGSCILPNGIDPDEISSRAAAARRIRPDAGPVIGMVSRLDAIKDHCTLLRAFALFHRETPDAELWIIGDGPSRVVLEEQAQDLGIRASARFLGSRTDVADLLGQIDVFAFSTTRDEGFGIALIEAMAAGVPVVASDVAACREVLADGDAGILVPPAEPEAMAAAFKALLVGADIRRGFIDRAFTRVQREYGIHICARRWEALLLGSEIRSTSLVKCAS
jgi:glycosyltransferase involved in cell wall biosynthesis